MDAMTNIILKVMAFSGSIATFMFIQRFFSPAKEKVSHIVSAEDLERKELSPFAKLDSNKSLLDKLDIFLARKCGFEKKLTEAYVLLGKPDNTDPLKMLHQKEIAAVVLFVGLYFLSGSAFSVIFLFLGFAIPDVLNSRKIRERQEDIIRSFPTFVDLAALMIESGQDYMTAFDKIVKISPEKTGLEREVALTIDEVQMGYSRRDSLRRFAARTGLQEIRSFVGLVIQSDELGTSLVELLRNFSADMRFRRLNRAEKLAAQASTKMLIPLFIFIFPTVFILMLAPMISDLLTGGMPF